MASLRQGSAKKAGPAPKSIKNVVGVLHSVFDLAMRRRVVRENPCRLVERPKVRDADPDIRFLDQTELEAMLRAVQRATGVPVELADFQVRAISEGGDAQGHRCGRAEREELRVPHPSPFSLRHVLGSVTGHREHSVIAVWQNCLNPVKQARSDSRSQGACG